MAFASLENKPFKLFNIPMQAGMNRNDANKLRIDDNVIYIDGIT